MTEPVKDGADGAPDNEMFGRAKRAEAALKDAEGRIAALQTEIDGLKVAKPAPQPPVDDATKARVEEIGKKADEALYAQRTTALMSTLGVNEKFAKDLLARHGGDLDKALTAANDAESLDGMAVASFRRKTNIARNTPSPTGQQTATYQSNGKNVPYHELPPEEQRALYNLDNSRFRR